LTQIFNEVVIGKTKHRSDAQLVARDLLGGDSSSINGSYFIRTIAQHKLLSPRATKQKNVPFEQGWGKYLRADDVFFRIVERGSSRLQSLSKMANVRFGVKTGANEFFYVTEDGPTTRYKKQKVSGKSQRESLSTPGLLALSDVASVRRGITTGANAFFYLSRAKEKNNSAGVPNSSTNGLTTVRDSTGTLRQIESALLSPVVFSLKDISGIKLDRVASQRMLFNCPVAPEKLAGTHALQYIRSGERARFHRRPSCANREPWYSVASRMKPAPLILPSKIGERWLVAVNHAQVFEDKKLYGVFPGRGVPMLVLAALLNSTWARYYVEVTCRQLTGAQAIADIDVAVAEQIMLPDPLELSSSIKKKLEKAVERLSRRMVCSIFEENNRADRRRLDELTLEAIGFRDRTERAEVLDQLYNAISKLVRARLSKSDDRRNTLLTE
jgi:hypothetical protein